MRRAGGAVIAALAGFWLLVQSPLAFAAGPDCLRGFITELRKAVADQDEAEDMFARITIFSDDGNPAGARRPFRGPVGEPG